MDHKLLQGFFIQVHSDKNAIKTCANSLVQTVVNSSHGISMDQPAVSHGVGLSHRIGHGVVGGVVGRGVGLGHGVGVFDGVGHGVGLIIRLLNIWL